MPSKKQLVIVAYVPVLHRGYLQFFEAHKSAIALYVIGDELLKAEDYIRKDLRALKADDMVQILQAMGLFERVQKLSVQDIRTLDRRDMHIVLPDEDISHTIAKQFKKAKVTLYPVFLRWDRRSAEEIDIKDPDEEITAGEFEQSVMKKALEAAKQSSDIWRRVGAVLISKDGRESTAANRGEPHAHSPWMEGDPRNVFSRGIGIEMSVFTHAEATLIAEAARRGVSLEGADLYVTTFPCPACAKLIAHSGIKTCYYKDGYAVLDGKRIMTEYGVRLLRVKMDDQPADNGPEWVKYKKSVS